MPRVVLASAIARWMNTHPEIGTGEHSAFVEGKTVRELFSQLFLRFPQIRGYIVDERDTIRHHVVVYVNGNPVTDKVNYADPVTDDAEVYIFQALSGG